MLRLLITRRIIRNKNLIIIYLKSKKNCNLYKQDFKGTQIFIYLHLLKFVS